MTVKPLYVAGRIINPAIVILPLFLLIIPAALTTILPPVVQFLVVVGIATSVLLLILKLHYHSGNLAMPLETKGYPPLDAAALQDIQKQHLRNVYPALAQASRIYLETRSKKEIRTAQKASDVYLLAKKLPHYDEAVLLPVWSDETQAESLLSLFNILAEQRTASLLEQISLQNEAAS